MPLESCVVPERKNGDASCSGELCRQPTKARDKGAEHATFVLLTPKTAGDALKRGYRREAADPTSNSIEQHNRKIALHFSVRFTKNWPNFCDRGEPNRLALEPFTREKPILRADAI